MSPLMKYTLARLAVFVVVAAALFYAPIELDPLLRLMIALLVSAIASYFLLGALRGRVGEQVAGAAERRAQKKERLRAALAGDDDKDSGDKA